MAKNKEEKTVVTSETVPVEEVKAPAKGKFVILDSNGKEVRFVDTLEQAQALVKVYGGRIKK